MRKIILFFLGIFYVVEVASATDFDDYHGGGVINGYVKSEDLNPVTGAIVILSELNKGTTTNKDGWFEFRNLKDGYYNLDVRSMGYAAQGRVVQLQSGHTEITFVLNHSYIELSEVIVRESATGVVQAEKSLNITTAGKDFFDQAPGLTMVQALQRIPGINSMDIGTGVSKPVIRGLGFNRLVVAQNNIKQQGQQWGADHGLEIDPFGIERVEVIKGPSSLLFGSDAIGGAINIRPPVVPQENSTRAEVQTIARSNNDLLGGSAMVALNRNGRFLRLRTSYSDYGDYRVPADEFVYNRWVMPIPGRRLENTSGQDLAFSLISGIRGAWGVSSITVSNFNQQVGFFPASHGIPDPSDLDIPGDPRDTKYPLQRVNHLKIASNTNFLAGSNLMELDLGFQQNHRKEMNPPHLHGVGPLPEGNTELELLLNTYSANLRYHLRRSSTHNLLFGVSGSLQENTRGGFNFLLPDFRYAELGIFLVSRWNINDVLFWNAGLRADAAMIEIEQFLEPMWQDAVTQIGFRQRAPHLERDYLNLAFSGGVSWIINSEINFKANLGRSFRNPTAIELAANGMHHGSFRHEMGDTALVPENAWQLDFGLTYQKREFYFHLSPFVNYFANFLYLNPSGLFSELPGAGQIYRFQQARALHYGGELYTDWHITKALHTSLGVEHVWAQNIDNNFPLPFTPPSAVVAEINYKWHDPFSNVENIRFLFSTRSVAAQRRVARNEPPTEGYTLVNSGLMARLVNGRVSLDASFMVNNLFNTHYKNHLSFYRILELPEPGRNYVLTIRINFEE